MPTGPRPALKRRLIGGARLLESFTVEKGIATKAISLKVVCRACGDNGVREHGEFVISQSAQRATEQEPGRGGVHMIFYQLERNGQRLVIAVETQQRHRFPHQRIVCSWLDSKRVIRLLKVRGEIALSQIPMRVGAKMVVESRHL